MKNIVDLARTDLRLAASSTISLIVLFGVAVIPSFFGWFNVLSSWDPFGNVKNMSVAVANADDGYASDLFPLKVNVGEQVLSSLRANSDLTWVFTSKADAIEGTRSEKYYAALILPPTFSRDMMTFLAPDAKPVKLEYYTNEKANALAPKITGEAATDVSTQIDQSFTKTLDTVALTLVSSLADQLNGPGMQAGLVRLEARSDQLASQLRAGAATAQMFTALITGSKPLVTSADQLMGSSADLLRNSAGPVRHGVDAATQLTSASAATATALSQALSASTDRFASLAQQVDSLYAALDADAQGVAAPLATVSGEISTQITALHGFRDTLQAQADGTSDPDVRNALESVISELDGAIARQGALQDRLDMASAAIASGVAQSQANRAEVRTMVTDAASALRDVQNAYNTALSPQLKRLGSTLASIGGDVGSITSLIATSESALSGASGSLLDALTTAESLSTSMSASLVHSAEGFDAVSAALKRASSTGDLTEVTKLIGGNSALFAGELTAPVGLDRIPVFAVDSFGAQMTPFYSVLGLWVGALLLSVLIRVSASRETFSPRIALSPAQEYLGRYGIFALLGFVQSSLLYLGLIGFVGVRPAHPFLLILAGWVMSLVFTLITYTLVVSFGEAGKALAVVLLVVQISAGGGAYPLSLLPEWFQSISPFLPVTHATDAVRSAIGGIYDSDYWISLGWLALFIVPALLLGLVLRLPLIAMNDNLARSLESTKLM